ncbi:MAG: hypothetical protein J6K15_11020 [Lachnospiraceae bacterium]|nr:hypothetical protein [Lachnospiraceae bacterium]MBP3578633.1 hypothetical protein [Lachnospiraceae bacterium]
MPLLSVYNHLMQGLIMMRPNRFDTHKKSELQNVYRDIMRLTSEQPLYKVTFDESAQEYTLGIKNAALSLSSMVKELNTDDSASVFKNQILTSDQPETVDVTVLEGSSLPDESLPLYVEVSSLSSPQENHGNFVPADEATLVSGQYNFTIGIEENLYSFQFNVSNGATNLDLQKKLADFINKTSIGLRTRIVQEPETGQSRLDLIAITAGSTDRESSFRPADVRFPEDASHGIITHFGLDRIGKAPVNTCFSINGKQKEVRGRSYLYNNALTLSIKEVTSAPVTIGKVTNQEPIAEKLRTFVNKYNSIFDFVKQQQPDNHRAKKLLYELGTTLRQFSSELGTCGLSVSKEGTLSIREKEMYAAAGNGSLERLFSEDSRFSSTLVKKLSDIALNPMEYLNKTVVTYPNITAKKTLNPYVSSIYCGLLYNNYC